VMRRVAEHFEIVIWRSLRDVPSWGFLRVPPKRCIIRNQVA